MFQIMQNRTERPSAIVCIAYRQLSVMTGIKDPTEEPKVEEIKQESREMNAIVEKKMLDLTNLCMQDFFEFPRNIMEYFRSITIDDLKVCIAQFPEQSKSIFELFSSNLKKWFQREE